MFLFLFLFQIEFKRVGIERGRAWDRRGRGRSGDRGIREGFDWIRGGAARLGFGLCCRSWEDQRRQDLDLDRLSSMGRLQKNPCWEGEKKDFSSSRPRRRKCGWKQREDCRERLGLKPWEPRAGCRHFDSSLVQSCHENESGSNIYWTYMASQEESGPRRMDHGIEFSVGFKKKKKKKRVSP